MARLTKGFNGAGASDERTAAVREFATSVSNPQDAQAAFAGNWTDAWHDDDENAVTVIMLKFVKAEARELQPFRIEDDGHRPRADVDRFIAAIQATTFGDEKIALAERECIEHPTPPFDAGQLQQILACFTTFGDEGVHVLRAFTGPAIVYKMTCAEVTHEPRRQAAHFRFSAFTHTRIVSVVRCFAVFPDDSRRPTCPRTSPPGPMTPLST